MRIAFLSLVALTLVIPSQPLAAKVVDGLYRAETIVTGTEEPERTRGFREALQTVIVKLTGKTDLANDPRIDELAKSPHPFVMSHEYEDRMKDIPVHDEQGTRERPHFLRVTFSKAAIDAELRRLGIAQWNADRPLVAVWLAIETSASRFVLIGSGPDGYGQRAVITEAAAKLGLPIELPGPTQSAVSVEDVANDQFATLHGAAPDADAHLVGRLAVRNDGYWDMAWIFHAPKTVHEWSLSGVTFDRALKHGLAKAAETLSGTAGK
ncbi:MAG: DUF2066 domain-containing protein [Hyphomicrobiaceae bacterium]